MIGPVRPLRDADYIDFLRSVTPGNAEDHLNQLRRFNMGQVGDVDCPVFDGVYEYCQVCPLSLSSSSGVAGLVQCACSLLRVAAQVQAIAVTAEPHQPCCPSCAQIYAGGSVNGASLITQGKADLALNWSGQYCADMSQRRAACPCNMACLCWFLVGYNSIAACRVCIMLGLHPLTAEAWEQHLIVHVSPLIVYVLCLDTPQHPGLWLVHMRIRAPSSPCSATLLKC